MAGTRHEAVHVRGELLRRGRREPTDRAAGHRPRVPATPAIRAPSRKAPGGAGRLTLLAMDRQWTMSRLVIPHAPIADPDDRDRHAGHDPGRVPDPDHGLAHVRREGELVEPVGQVERRRDQVEQVRDHHEDGRDLGRDRRPPQAADGDADADDRDGVDPERRRPMIASLASRPPDAAPRPTPAANRAVITTTARIAAMPPAITHFARASGVARTSSSRPSVSSEAHFETNVAAAKPAAMKSISMYSCSQPPTDVRSTPGNMRREDALRSWSRPPSWSASVPTARRRRSRSARGRCPTRAPAAAARRTPG